MGAGWRRWRAPVATVAVILAGGVVIALLGAGPAATGQLDPRDVGPAGAHALAALLIGQGKRVSRVDTVAAALAQSRAPGTAVVIADPGQIASSSLPKLAAAPADLLIIAPTRDALAGLVPGVTLAAVAGVASYQPRCSWPGARLAGPADMGGMLLRLPARGGWRCYPVGGAAARPAGTKPGPGAPPRTGYASLVRYQRGGRVITVLGTGVPLTNRDLGNNGNAALALNLLANDARVVWLMPGPVAGAGARSGSVYRLIPRPVYLVIAEIAVALVLTALWRMRRFGPLVFEPLPVLVRASETAEGHGRLYRSRRARGRAAAALRAASVARITARTGLPPTAPPEAVGRELARRTGRGEEEIHAMLFGPAPGDDAALVKLASDLDVLEGQVLTH
jgi:hypothetical protein